MRIVSWNCNMGFGKKAQFGDEFTTRHSGVASTIWDRHYREHSHSQLVEKLERLGLVSAYHTLHSELQGQEAIPTQYMYRHLSKPYHLDYAFVSQALSRSCELLVGEPGEWLHLSDHMPLLLTVPI